MKLTNVAFEPKDEKNNHYEGVPIEYPKGSGLKAIKLRQNGSEVMFAEPNSVSVEMEYRDVSDVVKGIMLHVGGIYDLLGEKKYAASEGCYGITNSDNDYSNDYSNKIIDTIIKQSRKSKKEKNKIEVVIEKRNANERPKSINVIIK